MFKRVIIYTLNCGDVEVHLYGVDGNSTVVVDFDSRVSQLIELLRSLAVRRRHWESDQPGVLEVEHMTF